MGIDGGECHIRALHGQARRAGRLRGGAFLFCLRPLTIARPLSVAGIRNIGTECLSSSHPTTTFGELPSAAAGVLTAAALGWAPAPTQGFPDRAHQYLATLRAISLDSGEHGRGESLAREQAVATLVLYLDGKSTQTNQKLMPVLFQVLPRSLTDPSNRGAVRGRDRAALVEP